MLTKFSHWLAALCLITAFTTAQAELYSPGNGYTLIDNPVTVMADGKIHVEEAFWYGCPHCYHLEAVVTPWSKQLAKDVQFTAVPAQFGRPWVTHAQLFYTAQVLGVLDTVNAPIFNAFHEQRKQLLSKSDQRNFLADVAGVAPADFDKAYDSFTVRSRMKQADQRIKAFGINGVPAIIVQGKYIVDASSAGGQHNILKVVDFLINKERQALAK